MILAKVQKCYETRGRRNNRTFYWTSYKEAMDNGIYVGDDGPTTTVETSDDRGSKTAVSEAEQQTMQSNTESQRGMVSAEM